MSRPDLSFLRPPCRLQMVWSTAAGEQAAYSGHLRGVLDDQLDVHLLGYGLVPSALRAGEVVSIQVPNDTGVFDIPSQIVSEDLTGDLLIAVTGEVRRFDRRRYPRARVALAATTAFQIFGGSRPPTAIPVRILELSGGGARIECLQPLEVGQVLQILVPIPEVQPAFAVVTVLEVLSSPGPSRIHPTNRTIVRVEFCRLLESERRLILRYVAHEREQINP